MEWIGSKLFKASEILGSLIPFCELVVAVAVVVVVLLVAGVSGRKVIGDFVVAIGEEDGDNGLANFLFGESDLDLN